MSDPAPTPRRSALSGLGADLKPVVYGGNDGIVTTFAIVAGFAGASAEGAAQIGTLAVLVFGFANLFADGVSMGLGEFLSGRSKAKLFAAELARRRRGVAENGPGAAHALAQHFGRRGLATVEAEAVGAAMARHPEAAAEILTAIETGIADPRGERPGRSGAVTFAAFLAFGFLPLLPYLLGLAPERAFPASVAATFAALTLLGTLRWCATGERFLRAAGETVAVGGLCAAVAFVTGWLVGAA